ncbi:MAG: glycosyltransferase family 39 protein [Anaerolineae bacterium]|nr:glycosyltransferase family 39 protein [Anaerolineae bacterium]
MRQTRFLVQVTLLLLLGFALRVISLGDDSLWSDEAFTVFFADAPAAEFVPLLLTDGVHVPLYFLLMRALPTGNDFMLRWPSVLLGVSGITLLIWVTLRLYGSRPLALWAGLLLACNPYHIWLSRVARPYALFFITALLASYYFLVLLRGERSAAHWAGLGLSSAACYMTHFFAAALPLAQYIVLGFTLQRPFEKLFPPTPNPSPTRREGLSGRAFLPSPLVGEGPGMGGKGWRTTSQGNRRLLRQWLLVQVVALAPLAWWVYRLVTQEVVSFGIAWIPRPALADLPATLANMGVGPDGFALLLLPALLALAVGLTAGTYRAWSAWRAVPTDLYWFWLVTLALLPIFLLSQARPFYVDRYFMVFLPGLLLLTLRGWSALARGGLGSLKLLSPVTWLAGRSWAGVLAAIVVISGTVQVSWSLANESNERQSWHDASAFVADEYQPGDGFVMEPALSLLPFLRYWQDEALLRANLVLPQNVLAAPHDRLWAIVTSPEVNIHREQALGPFDPLAPGDSALSRWLAGQRDHVAAQHEVNGVAVLLIVQGTD